MSQFVLSLNWRYVTGEVSLKILPRVKIRHYFPLEHVPVSQCLFSNFKFSMPCSVDLALGHGGEKNFLERHYLYHSLFQTMPGNV